MTNPNQLMIDSHQNPFSLIPHFKFIQINKKNSGKKWEFLKQGRKTMMGMLFRA
jgi:hypothetical protein